jgi:proline dehydrogenase
MRSALLKASQSAFLREHAPRLRFVRRTATRFMPGETIEEAITAAREVEQRGLGTLVTHLGENVTSAAQAQAVRQIYLEILGRFRQAKLRTELSVKLTHLGLDGGIDECLANFMPLVEAAGPESTVWIDMEGSAYTERTVELFRRARAQAATVAICLQAYLHRTRWDVEAMILLGATVRLVKGAYREPPDVAYQKKPDVDGNFLRTAQRLLSPEARDNGVHAAFATHDPRLIRRIEQYGAEQALPRKSLQFQMLYGIQTGEQTRLAAEGYDSRVLINFGANWYAWFMRRMAERPANVWLALRNIF